MRVTKLIREYVCKKVRENFPQTAEEIAWEELKDRAIKAQTKANDLIGKYAKKIAEEVNAEFGLPDDYNLSSYDDRNYVSSCWCSRADAYQKASKARDVRDKKIAETIEDILITLEMGGTRADLDAKLAEIAKGE